jgi:glutamate synthase (NADPH/NADH) small chain
MATKTGFKTYERQNFKLRPKTQRLNDDNEVYKPLSESLMVDQAKRCMGCGTTFCSWGCPLGNLISYWNDFSHQEKWEEAYEALSRTSNFPEFTSRVCPAPCEAACVLGVNREPVSIREIEYTIIEHAFENGWVKPRRPKTRTGKRIAVVGSGPAGMAVADELNAVGHEIVVFERNLEPGGLLRYGIPNFKLEKSVIDRRIDLMKDAGVRFVTNTAVGKDVKATDLLEEFDAIVLTGGSTVPRDLTVMGRELDGIHYAVDYLENHTKRIHDLPTETLIDARGKNVLVIGGGDTGSDCIGTANRQGANKVYQVEILPKAPDQRDDSQPWPIYPRLNKVTSSHKEGCEQFWEVSTKRLVGENGAVKKAVIEKINWVNSDGRMIPEPVEGSEVELEVDLVLLAMGFLSPEHDGVVNDLGLALDARGNVHSNERHETNIKGVFTAGDMARGQSLVVRAIKEGRTAAKYVDEYLMGESYIRTFK